MVRHRRTNQIKGVGCGIAAPILWRIYNKPMPEYRRSRLEGGTFFFTVVTYHRRPLFITAAARELLHQAWTDTCNRFPFETLAICLLPNHLHCIWRLPEGEWDYSTRWGQIKGSFTKKYLKMVGPGAERNPSRIMRDEAAIWQRRFWEHAIQNEDDLQTHLDYIHYNPVKHGYVTRPADWQWSSFSRYVKQGFYEIDWGEGDMVIKNIQLNE